MQACGQCILAPIHLKSGAPLVITTTDVFIPRLVSPERPLVQHWTVLYQDTYGALAGPSLYRLAFTPKATLLEIPQPTWLPEPLRLRPCDRAHLLEVSSPHPLPQRESAGNDCVLCWASGPVFLWWAPQGFGPLSLCVLENSRLMFHWKIQESRRLNPLAAWMEAEVGCIFLSAFSMQRLKNQWSTFCIQSCIVLIHGPIGVPCPCCGLC